MDVKKLSYSFHKWIQLNNMTKFLRKINRFFLVKQTVLEEMTGIYDDFY